MAKLMSLCALLNQCDRGLAEAEAIRPQTDATVIASANLFSLRERIIRELLEEANEES